MAPSSGTIILSAKDNKSTYVNSRGYWSTNSKKDYKYGAISAESSTITAASSTSLANVKVWDIPSAGETFVWTVVDVIKVKDEDGNETEVEKCPVSKSVTVKNCNIAATIETTDFDACNGETTIYAKDIFSVNGAKGSWQLVSQPSEQVGQVKLNGTGVDALGSVDANKSNKLDISNMTASGSYKFKWNVEYNDNGTAMCPLTAEFTVRNNSLTTKADRKGPDASVDVCGDSYTLSATDHGTGYQGKWTDENGNALVTDGEGVTGFRISDPSSSTATVYGIPSEDTPIKWTVTKMITKVKVGTDGEPVLDENDKPVYETVATTCSASDVVTLKNEKAVANAKTTTNPICDGGAALTSNNVITSKLTGVWEKSAENQMGHFVYNGQTYDRLEVNSDNAAAVDVRYEGINNGNTVSVKWTVNKTVEGQNCASDAKVISLTNNGFDLSVNGGTSRRTCDNTAELTGNMSDNCTGWWTSDGSAKFVVAGEGENTTKTDRVDAATVNVVDLSNDPAGNSFTWHVKSNACPERSVNFMIFNDQPTASILNADKLNNSVNCNEKLTINAAPFVYPSEEKGQWTGDATFSDEGKNPEVTLSGMTPNSEVNLKWTVTRGACTAEATVQFTNKSYTPVILTNPSIYGNCISTITLEAQAVEGITGYWTCDVPRIQEAISAINSTNKIDIVDLPYGNTIFHWTLEDAASCGKRSTPITVSNSQVNGFPGDEDYVCGSSYTMKADLLPVETAEGTWTIDENGSVAGAVISDIDKHNPKTTVTGLGRGKTTLVWTVKNYYDENDRTKYCESAKSVVINNMDFDVDALAGSESKTMDICGKTTDLNAMSAPSDGVGTWTTTAATFAGETDEDKAAEANKSNANITLTGSDAELTWTVVRTFKNAKGEEQTCTKSDVVTVYNRTPSVSVKSSENTCDGNVDLAATLVDAVHEAGFWTRGENDCKFSGFDGTIANTNAVTVTDIPAASTVTVNWNVKSTRAGLANCVTTAPVTLTNYYYKPTASSSPNTPSFCPEIDGEGNVADKEINIIGSLPGANHVVFTGKWTATGVAIKANEDTSPSTTATFTGANGGKYTITWTVTPKDANVVCQDNAANIVITNMYPGKPSISTVDHRCS